MAKKDIGTEEIKTENQENRVVSRELVSEMRTSFIDYAMSVITDRALTGCS